MRLPYAEVEFTTQGDVAKDQQVAAAVAMARDHNATDVLLLAHGWNNDMPQARRLFERIVGNLADELQSSTRTVVVIGLLWPAVRWADDDDIAGGGVSTVDPLAALDAAIAESVEDPGVAAALRSAAAQLEASGDGQDAFVTALRPLLPADGGGGEDPVPQALAEGDARALFSAVEEAELAADDDDLFADDAATPAEMPPGIEPDLLGGTPVTGTGVNLLSPVVLARRLLNVSTYYTMKDRAGKVGARGVAQLVRRLHHELPNNATVHLAGHSFGARVVSAAAAASDVPIGSVTLLQGAFSHFGFARNYAESGKDGAFRRALTSGQVRGPIVITHTRNDRAVRTAYAIASRIARQTGAAIGGPGDPYGGVGANGAVATEEASGSELKDRNATYDFTAGRIHNLRADRYVAGHSAVTGREVVHALADAMAAVG